MRLAASHLKAICPRAKPAIIDCVLRHWDGVLLAYNITDRLEIIHLLTQIFAETNGLQSLEENLRYPKDGFRLWEVFGKAHFASEADASIVAGQGPQAIANRVYGGRFGNSQPGFGWRYRGQGLIDLTFRDNYAAVSRSKISKFPDLVAHPELVSHPDYALEVACAYWRMRKIGIPARKDDIISVTKLVQGGSGGLSDRKSYLARTKRLLLGVDLALIRPTGGKMVDNPSPAPGTISLPAELAQSLLQLLMQAAQSKAPGAILANMDLSGFANKSMPAPSWIVGKRTYIASIAGALGTMATIVSAYSSGQLTLGTAVAGGFTALSAFGGVAAVRAAITNHFGAIGGAVIDLIATFLQQLETQQAPPPK